MFVCNKSVSQSVRISARQDEAAGRVESSSPCRARQAGEGLLKNLFSPFSHFERNPFFIDACVNAG